MLRLTIICLSLLTVSPVLFAQEKSVKIRWFGQSCFQVETPTGKKIVFDPHAIPAFGSLKPEANLVLVSHEHNDHNQPEITAKFKENKPKVIRGLKVTPGINKYDWNNVDEKWEGVRIRSFGTYHDEVDGTKRGKNTMFIIDVDGIIICHCGDLGHELTEKQVKAIGPVDVLLIPVGGIYTINGRTAVDVVDQIKPRLYAIPMHYGTPDFGDLQNPDEFFDDMIANKKKIKKTLDKNEIDIPVGTKGTGYTVLQLGYKKE